MGRSKSRGRGKYNACIRKVPFDTRELAQANCDANWKDLTLIVYKCQHCPKFHLGHNARQAKSERITGTTAAGLKRRWFLWVRDNEPLGSYR